MKYPIKAKEGSPIVTTDDCAIPLHGIKDIFDLCSSREQIHLCNQLGISFHSDNLTISFKERGQIYELPNEDRNIISDKETECSFNLVFRTVFDENKFPLKLSINLNECSDQPYVNFLGEIRFRNSQNSEVVVPLIGRGTAALEGRVNDAHAGLCTSNKTASFQERIAILSCILANFNLSRDDIEIYRAHLLKICNKYLGIEDMLSYTLDKAFSLTDESYFSYMNNIYFEKDESETPIMLNHFIEFGEPHPAYFYELTLNLSPEEIDQELKEISSNSRGPDKKIISPRVRDIINKFILADNIYLIKPFGMKLKFKTEDEEKTIYDIADEFNSNSIERILNVLGKIGISLNNETVSVSFFEKGQKYISNSKETFLSNSISEYNFHMELKRKSQLIENLLKLKVFLDIDPIDNINFLGKIEIKHSIFRKIVIPLVGRGTIALESSLNDNYMGFCLGDNCSSFLQRVAIVYCSLILLDVDKNDLQKFEENIKSINLSYHKEHKIVDYIFKVAKEEENESYFNYMKRINMDYSTMPITLKTILTYNRLPLKYYQDVISKFTEEELIKEEQRFEKSTTLKFLPNAYFQIKSFLENLNIF